MTADTAELRYVLIVSRERPELYDEMRRRFTGDATVDVVVDRRVGDRRHRDEGRSDDRRRGDRRQAAMHVTASLWLAGYVIVRVR
jgi:hypothetical protein